MGVRIGTALLEGNLDVHGHNLCNLHSVDLTLLFEEFILRDGPDLHLEYSLIVAFFTMSRNWRSPIFSNKIIVV